MDAVVFDLETTFTYEKGQTPEIIEIGARKINLSDPQSTQLNTFQCYTHPELRGRIGLRTRKFIGMKEADLERVVPFAQGIRQFIEWLGNDYYLCSWGGDDRLLFIEHCARYGISLNWLKNYNDIQPAISQLLGGRPQMKLKDAVVQSGLEVQGRLHSALTDAINTANLLIKHRAAVQLEKNTPQENYSMSCALYWTCRKCAKEKHYTAFSGSKRFCQECATGKQEAGRTSAPRQ
ncbi:exonuclease domain-containing protein [Brevibacillus borstelensis]|uniref:exonuclease domain-containing protein n=1 Tax=Brevibacillus borstelensis TaxID=45462 RepID=UPI0030C24316